jgi:hypothetical protein
MHIVIIGKSLEIKKNLNCNVQELADSVVQNGCNEKVKCLCVCFCIHSNENAKSKF